MPKLWNLATVLKLGVIVGRMISDNERNVVEPVSRGATGSGPAVQGTSQVARATGPRESVVVRWVAVSCAALALGSLGTWATAHLGTLTITASGLDGWWGKLTLAAAVLTVVPVVQPDWIKGWAWGARHYLDVALVLAWASLAACVYNLFASNGDGYAAPGIESPSWGLYLATVASVGVIVSTIALRRASPVHDE